MEKKQKQNKIFLSALCLKPAFAAAVNDHECRQDTSMFKSNLRIFWKKAVELIPIVLGQDGEKAIKLMRKIAYLEDDTFDITVLGKYWCQLDISDRHRLKVYDILISFGLMDRSNFTCQITSNNQLWINGMIRIHSSTLLEVIREDNERVKLKKGLLKECAQTFDLENVPKYYNAIWTPIFSSNWDDIIQECHSIGSFYERYFYDDNIAPRDKALFDKTLLKYEELYGAAHEMTMELRILDLYAIFRTQNLNLEEKWNVWCQKIKLHLGIFIQTPTVELYEGKRWNKLLYLLDSLKTHFNTNSDLSQLIIKFKSNLFIVYIPNLGNYFTGF